MKNNFFKYFIFFLLLMLSTKLHADEILVNASEVEVRKQNQIVYAKGNVEIKDNANNTIFSDGAEYDKINGVVKTFGPTKIITSKNYHIEGEDIIYDDKKKIIYSQNQTSITDIDNNKIDVEMFNYLTLKNIMV